MAKTLRDVYTHRGQDIKLAILDENQSIGGSWAKERIYKDLQTNNIVGTFEFSDYPMSLQKYSLRTGQHIPGIVVHQYLVDVAEHFNLLDHIKLQTRVETTTLQGDGSWMLEYTTASSSSVSKGKISTKRLVIATGLTSTPNLPPLCGRDLFRGNLFHAKDLHEREKDLEEARDVVVIGGNKSATDASYAAARAGARVHLIIRPSGGGPSWIWRPLGFKIGSFKMTIARMTTTRCFNCLDPNPFAFATEKKPVIQKFLHQSALGILITSIFWAILNFLCQWLLGYRDGRLRMVQPWTSVFWMGNSLSVHNYDENWFDMLKSGQNRGASFRDRGSRRPYCTLDKRTDLESRYNYFLHWVEI